MGLTHMEIPSVKELWLENGRFVTARSGVLVIRVLDIKDRNECRYLICDGGRTNHALVSDWETHRLEVFPDRQGEPVLSTVCGPTCRAFDRLCRVMLPRDVMPGDVLIWRDAGAYHLPWETRLPLRCGRDHRRPAPSDAALSLRVPDRCGTDPSPCSASGSTVP